MSTLEFGVVAGEVVMQLNQLPVDAHGNVFFTFTPEKARALAQIILDKAQEAEKETHGGQTQSASGEGPAHPGADSQQKQS